MEDVEKDLRGR